MGLVIIRAIIWCLMFIPLVVIYWCIVKRGVNSQCSILLKEGYFRKCVFLFECIKNSNWNHKTLSLRNFYNKIQAYVVILKPTSIKTIRFFRDYQKTFYISQLLSVKYCAISANVKIRCCFQFSINIFRNECPSLPCQHRLSLAIPC
jgi:hypothetical protein